MFKSGKLKKGLGIALILLITASIIVAQEAGNRRGQGQGQGQGQRQPGQRPDRGFGGPGGFDREAMQERMLSMFQERLEISDEEWKVVKPRLSEVMKLSQSASGRGGMMRGMFGRGRGRGPNGQEAPTPTDPVEKAVVDLQTTLEKDAPTAAEIKSKLTALRGAKEKAKLQLVEAQKKLREVLTLKQEASLVLMGMLD